MTMEGTNASTAPQANERIPLLKPARCIGRSCVYFSEEPCAPMLELDNAHGDWDAELPPMVTDSRYAEYNLVCMGSGDEGVVIGRLGESPNGKATPAELASRMGKPKT